MKLQLALLSLVLSSQVFAYTHWNHVRHSALLPGGEVTVRVESPSGAGTSNHLLYEDGGISGEPMEPILDGPSTVEATAPGPASATRRYGFRLVQPGGVLDLFPVVLPGGSDPGPADLSQLNDDPVGDELFGYDNLDLTSCRTSYSGERLYAALVNAGGGFPTAQGLTFFGYVYGLADPAEPDPDTVYAMLYTVDQPGIIEPGLYRIVGSGMEDLEKIGDVDITTFPALDALMMSCQLTDLLGDPGFSSWFDPENRTVAAAAFTQRITLGSGAQEADRTEGGDCHLRQLVIEPGTNSLPELDDAVFEGSGAQATVSVDYSDEDGHCPLLSEITFDGEDSFPLYPLTLDYGGTVTYRSEEGIEPLASGDWVEATFHFSDNETDVVELQVFNSSAGEAGLPGPSLSVAPNPMTGTSVIEVDLRSPAWVLVCAYDAAGRRVATVYEGMLGAGRSGIQWVAVDGGGRPLQRGVYFLHVRLGGTELVRRVLLLE